MIKKNLLIIGTIGVLFVLSLQVFAFAQESSAYNLKLNLEPKLVESRNYFKEDQLCNWDFGLLSTKEEIPPLIIKTENFFQMETNRKINYFWGGNRMKLSVLNPHESSIICTLFFEADAYKKPRDLEIWVNGSLHEKVKVPKQCLDLDQFSIRGIFLTPGINEIILVCPQGTDKIGFISGLKSFDRQVSVRFNENINFIIENFNEENIFQDETEYKFLNDVIGLQIKANLKEHSFPGIILSKNFNIDLNECPSVEFNCSSKENKLGFKMCFFVDISGDDQPDLFVDLEVFNFEEIDILKMVNNKISSVANNPKLLKIVLVGTFLPEVKNLAEIDFCLSECNFFSSNSAIELPIANVNIENWEIDNQFKGKVNAHFNGNSLRFLCGIDALDDGLTAFKKAKPNNVKRYFLKTNEVVIGEVLEHNKDKIKILKSADGEEIEVLLSQIKYSDNFFKDAINKEKDKLIVNFNLTNPIEPGILKFVYKVDNFAKQDIAVYVDLDRNNDGSVDARVLAGVRNDLPEWQLKQECHDFKIYESYRSPYNVGYSGEVIDVNSFALYNGFNLLKSSFDDSIKGGWLLDDPHSIDDKQLVLALPNKERLNPDKASIVYKVLTKNSMFPDWQNYEVDLSWLLKNEPDLKIKNISVHLLNKDSADINALSGFSLKSIGMYKRFAFPVLKNNREYQKLKEKISIPLLKIDEDIFYFKDFDQLTSLKDIKNNVIAKEINLKRGSHKYKKIKNDVVNIDWVLLEPINNIKINSGEKGPMIIFKQINPAKYVVDVKGAKRPFWLVFNDSFHSLWNVYHVDSNEPGLVIKDYPELQVKELKHEIKFSLKDIMFLSKKPLPIIHQTVNGYANGWYIEPEKLGLGEDFTLMLFFSSQAVLCLGLFLFLIMSLVFFARIVFIRRRNSAK
ncbi:MAG: hypothetical protein KJ915_02920 [Candidatus Omnitrophica bacterium]|nr:hypothetical protein [Candidatus Omnitrophota bacterium]